MQIITYLKNRPLRVGMLLMAAYFFYFIWPDAFGPNSFGRGTGINSAADLNDKLLSEIGLAASVLFVIGLFGWWRACGFTLKFHKGGMKFALPPLIFTTFILIFAVITASDGDQTIISLIGVGPLLTMLVVSMLIGVFEESLFRGIVFIGWNKKYGPFVALLASSLVFGVFHFINWATGQPFGETFWQVVHAFFLGIMYAALWLRIGSIYPVIFLHGFWDATVTIMSEATGAALATMPTVASGDGISIVQVLFFSLEPAYGLFVLWRWNIWRKRKE
ncbi:MAG: CPBP family intramembrane metalloprotease [Rhodobacteraceae bacterium]|nr:CPBP family intramembrane metalloprotease [Paracoccaceae bacterium]